MGVVDEPLLPIGMFSRASSLSIKALRAYHDAGILVPARVDPQSGYRSYTVGPARRCRGDRAAPRARRAARAGRPRARATAIRRSRARSSTSTGARWRRASTTSSRSSNELQSTTVDVTHTPRPRALRGREPHAGDGACGVDARRALGLAARRRSASSPPSAATLGAVTTGAPERELRRRDRARTTSRTWWPSSPSGSRSRSSAPRRRCASARCRTAGSRCSCTPAATTRSSTRYRDVGRMGRPSRDAPRRAACASTTSSARSDVDDPDRVPHRDRVADRAADVTRRAADLRGCARR